MSQLQKDRLRLQMQEVGELSDLDKQFKAILHAITHAATLNTGQDYIVEAGALLHDHYSTDYLSSLLDHTLQTDSFQPGLLHLWLHRRPQGWMEPCPDASFVKPLLPPQRPDIPLEPGYAHSLAGSTAPVPDDDVSTVSDFFEHLVSPLEPDQAFPARPPASAEGQAPAEFTSSSRGPARPDPSPRTEAVQINSLFEQILTTAHEKKPEHFTIFYISLPTWYSPDRVIGHPASTRRNLPLSAVLDILPVSPAEVLANPRKSPAAVLLLLNTVLKTPSLYRQQRFTLYQELIYRHVQVYCLSRAQGQEHDGATRRAHASVHAFIVPIFDGILTTHALVQTVLNTPGLSSEQQLTQILSAFDTKLRPTLDALSSTFDSLIIVIGETFLQLHERAMSLQVDNETVISNVAFYNKLYTLLRQASATSSVARDVLNTFVGPHYKHAPAQELYDGMQDFTFCKLPLLSAGGASGGAGGLDGTFISGDTTPLVPGDGRRPRPKIGAVHLGVMQKHLTLGRKATAGHVPCPKVIDGETCCWICFDLETKVLKWFAGAPANPKGTRFFHNPWRSMSRSGHLVGQVLQGQP